MLPSSPALPNVGTLSLFTHLQQAHIVREEKEGEEGEEEEKEGEEGEEEEKEEEGGGVRRSHSVKFEIVEVLFEAMVVLTPWNSCLQPFG